MTWYKVTMSVEQVANGKHMTLQDQFTSIFMAVGAPKDMALFSGMLSNKGLDIYFSPGSVSYAKGLIDSYSGTPCDKPDKKLPLLVGRSNAMDKLL